MRILRVIATVDPKAGGPVEGLRQTARIHAEWGHETVVASCDEDQTRKYSEDPFELVPLGPGKYGWSYSHRLRSWLENNLNSFDLVIMHGLWLYPSWALASIYDRRSEQKDDFPPFFVFCHGMLDPWFQSWKRRPLKTLRNNLYWRAIEARTVRSADGVLFTSSEERRLARLPFKPYKPAREIVLPYGTSTPPSPAAKLTEAFLTKADGLKQQPYLLFLSRLHEKKGIDLLLKAYARIQTENKEKPTPLPALIIAGPGMDEPYGIFLQSLVDELGLEKMVFFTGMLRGDAKWGAYHGCEAFILPSHQENFGIAVAEALACGKPVLISDKVNIWKEISEAEAGLVGEDTEGGIESILIEWFQTTESERKLISVKAAELFKKQYHVEASAQAILDLPTSSNV